MGWCLVQSELSGDSNVYCSYHKRTEERVCQGQQHRGWCRGGWTCTVSLTEYIQPVCLPAAGQALEDGKICTVTGWGNTQYYGESHPLPGKPPLGRLTWAGEGQSGRLGASWPWAIGTLRSLGWAPGGKGGVHAPQLSPALPAHPQANRLGYSRRHESP